MSATTLRYDLQEIENIIFQGFNYTVPEDTMKIISSLTMQVGSPNYDKTPVFKKRENMMKAEPSSGSSTAGAGVGVSSSSGGSSGKKRRNNKSMEIMNDEDWENIRTFQTTKMDSKTGIEKEFDAIRALINKITDKNYTEIRNKIIDNIDNIVSSNVAATNANAVELGIIGSNLFEIASSNRYYSKIYAELYVDLSAKYEFIKTLYEANLQQFIDSFNSIEFVEPDENYDKFCEINKINEKRKALAAFYMNLMNLGVVSKQTIIDITRNLIARIYDLISFENNKNQVDEITETIGIMYKSELFDDADVEYDLIQGLTVNEIIAKIASSKVKDYKSLTNKTLFKFMDLIDM
jgi:hypothetical protein